VTRSGGRVRAALIGGLSLGLLARPEIGQGQGIDVEARVKAAATPSLRSVLWEECPDCARLFAALESNPADEGTRASLIHAYRARGYAAAASFFTLRGRTSKGVAVDILARPQHYCAGETTQIGQMMRPARMLAANARWDDTVEGQKRAHEAIRTALQDVHRAPQCFLILELAEVILRWALPAPGADAIREEAAVRLLITGVDELHLWPIDAAGGSDCYGLLADYFERRDDLRSAVAALDLALLHFDRENPGSKNAARPTWESARNALLDKLRARPAKRTP
jgi:hypothetical protein